MADTVTAAPSPEKNPPRIDIELKQRETKGLDGLKPGDKVRVTIEGTITEINLREPYSESSEKYVGRLTMESKSTVVKEDVTGTMADLSVEDD